jgi:hypothetical protein
MIVQAAIKQNTTTKNKKRREENKKREQEGKEEGANSLKKDVENEEGFEA